MYQFFEDSPVNIKGSLSLPEFLYVRNQCNDQMVKLKNYYRKNITYLSPSHLVCNIINTFEVGYVGNMEKYLEAITNKTNSVALAMRLTSPTSKGKLFNGVFYGNKSFEVIIATENEWNMTTPWEELEPIRVIFHNRNGLNYVVPNVTDANLDAGGFLYSFIEINIPMLMYQYQMWYAKYNANKKENLLSIANFVMGYPLPNFMGSHFDLALFNRYVAIDQGGVLEETINRFPVPVVDETSRVDRLYGNYSEAIGNKRMGFEQLLATIPAVSKPNMLQVLYLGDRPHTRQISWALAISRIKAINYMLRYSIKVDSKVSKDEINRMRIGLLALTTDGSWVDVLGGGEAGRVLALLRNTTLPLLQKAK